MLSETDDAVERDPYASDGHILLDVLGDHPKAKLIAAFLTDHEKDMNVSEIADLADLKRDTVYKYLDDLRAWGIIEESRKVGNSQMYTLNTDSDIARGLGKLEHDIIDHLIEKEEAGDITEDYKPLP